MAGIGEVQSTSVLGLQRQDLASSPLGAVGNLRFKPDVGGTKGSSPGLLTRAVRSVGRLVSSFRSEASKARSVHLHKVRENSRKIGNLLGSLTASRDDKEAVGRIARAIEQLEEDAQGDLGNMVGGQDALSTYLDELSLKDLYALRDGALGSATAREAIMMSFRSQQNFDNSIRMAQAIAQLADDGDLGSATAREAIMKPFRLPQSLDNANSVLDQIADRLELRLAKETVGQALQKLCAVLATPPDLGRATQFVREVTDALNTLHTNLSMSGSSATRWSSLADGDGGVGKTVPLLNRYLQFLPVGEREQILAVLQSNRVQTVHDVLLAEEPVLEMMLDLSDIIKRGASDQNVQQRSGGLEKTPSPIVRRQGVKDYTPLVMLEHVRATVAKSEEGHLRILPDLRQLRHEHDLRKKEGEPREQKRWAEKTLYSLNVLMQKTDCTTDNWLPSARADVFNLARECLSTISVPIDDVGQDELLAVLKGLQEPLQSLPGLWQLLDEYEQGAKEGEQPNQGQRAVSTLTSLNAWLGDTLHLKNNFLPAVHEDMPWMVQACISTILDDVDDIGKGQLSTVFKEMDKPLTVLQNLRSLRDTHGLSKEDAPLGQKRLAAKTLHHLNILMGEMVRGGKEMGIPDQEKMQKLVREFVLTIFDDSDVSVDLIMQEKLRKIDGPSLAYLQETDNLKKFFPVPGNDEIENIFLERKGEIRKARERLGNLMRNKNISDIARLLSKNVSINILIEKLRDFSECELDRKEGVLSLDFEEGEYQGEVDSIIKEIKISDVNKKIISDVLSGMEEERKKLLNNSEGRSELDRVIASELVISMGLLKCFGASSDSPITFDDSMEDYSKATIKKTIANQYGLALHANGGVRVSDKFATALVKGVEIIWDDWNYKEIKLHDKEKNKYDVVRINKNFVQDAIERPLGSFFVTGFDDNGEWIEESYFSDGGGREIDGIEDGVLGRMREEMRISDWRLNDALVAIKKLMGKVGLEGFTRMLNQQICGPITEVYFNHGNMYSKNKGIDPDGNEEMEIPFFLLGKDVKGGDEGKANERVLVYLVGGPEMIADIRRDERGDYLLKYSVIMGNKESDVTGGKPVHAFAWWPDGLEGTPLHLTPDSWTKIQCDLKISWDYQKITLLGPAQFRHNLSANPVPLVWVA